MKIYLDIETIPTQNNEIKNYVCENLKAPANYKNPETIEKWLAENKPEVVNKTALDGAFGEIVVIGAAVDDTSPVLFYCEDWQLPDRETRILTQFNDWLRKHITKATPLMIGHNITKFDDRFIFQRSVINRIKPCYTPLRHNTYDTMTEWAGYGNTVSLDKLCKVLDIEQKGDIDGSKVWQYIQDGKINEVAQYCAKDVERVREIYKRMTFVE